MGIVGLSRLARIKPAYTITLSGTPAGKTWTTAGKLVSTPGTPARSGYSVRGRSLSSMRIKIAKAAAVRKAAAKKAREEAAKKELERARREALAREAARREAARRSLNQALKRARAKKSMTAQARARDAFRQTIETSKKEKERTMSKSGEEFRRLIAQAKKVPKDLFIEERVVDTFRRDGKEIPITKTIIVDERGKKVRDATAKEIEIVRRTREAIRVPEELKVGEGKVLADIEKKATELRQKRLRGKADVKGELELAGLTVAGTIIGAGIAITQLPKLPAAIASTLKRYVKDPKSIKEIPEAIGRGGAEFGYLAKISPTEAIVKIGSEYLVMKGVGKTLKVVGSLTSKAATKVSSGLKGIKVTKRAIFIPHLQKGKALTIKVSQKLGRGRIPDQLKFAGKRTTAVSAQADRLVNFIKTRKIVRKPIRGEEKLTKATKKLLKKFDDRKITSKELIQLDRRIAVEAKKGLLERSFFADPEGVVRKRFLRLGTEKEASLLDTLAGDVTFKTTKPQILIFKDVKVQAFPKTKIFKSITQKLKTGKVLTQKEAGKLLEFQLKKTGKFKPLGFQTSEMEITLAPGEIIKKHKTIAHVLIDKKRVAIVHAKVVKAKPITKKLLVKADKGKLTAPELKTLRKNLKKETGFTSSISDHTTSRPRLPLGRKSISVAVRPRRRAPKRKPVRRPPVRKPVRRPPKRALRRVPKRKPVKRITRRIPERIPKVKVVRRPPAKPAKVRRPATVIPIIPPTKKVAKPKKRKPIIRSYHVYAKPLKRKGKGTPKLIRITKKPISKIKAKDLRNYITDTSLSRTALIKGSSQAPSKRVLQTPTGYSSRTQHKFRKHKIVKKRKVPLRSGKVIERKKFIGDTKQEQKKLTLKRRVAQLQRQSRTPIKRTSVSRKTVRRTPARASTRRIISTPQTIKRKPSPAQLKALANGRKALAKKRKGGKR